MKYLLDTNIISEPLKPKPSNNVMRRLREHEDDIAIPAPVWHELRFGCARLALSRQREAIERYIEDVVLASFPALEYDQRAADWHAIERARLSVAGRTPAVRRRADRGDRLRQRPDLGYVEYGRFPRVQGVTNTKLGVSRERVCQVKLQTRSFVQSRLLMGTALLLPFDS